MSPHKGNVLARNGSIFELGCESRVGAIVFRHEKKTGGVFVQPVHNPGSEGSAYPGKFDAVTCQRIHEGSAGMTGSRVDYQSRRLVYDQKIVVFVPDVQINILRLSGQRLFAGYLDAQGLACGNRGTGFEMRDE